MHRPRHPRPDKRQPGEIAKLRAAGCTVIITASLGGPALDFLVVSPDWKRSVLVEFKNNIGQRFETSEIEVLEQAGIWRSPGPFSPPPGHAVMAAWRAEDILRHLGVKCKDK